MGFQAVFDNANSITVINRPQVAQSITRSGVIRSVERGNAVWRFEVSLPNGLPWNEYRSVIANYTGLDRYTEDTINFANTGYDWLFNYLGDEPNIENVRVNVINNQLSIATGVTIQSGFVFRSGDLIQLVGSKVYQVTEDVAFDASVIPTHRAPVNETVGTYDTNIGAAANFTVLCVSMPNFTLVERNQVAWDGAFVFQEVLN